MRTIKEVEEKGLVVYKYIRGSALYGTMVEGSDVDTSGVYIAPIEDVLGFDDRYQAQVSDEKHDNTYYEIKRWLELLCQSNPNALESLFVPKDKIIGDVHPAIQIILDNRDLFLTKQCFKSFYGYSSEQIKRARGLNKKIVNPVNEKKSVIDFCYVTYNQGSEPVKKFLERYGLKQEYCGLVAIPNMRDMYGVHYDWGAHFRDCNMTLPLQSYSNDDIENEVRDMFVENGFDIQFIFEKYAPKGWDDMYDMSVFLMNFLDEHKTPIHYRGIVAENSLDIRLSSVEKNSKPLFHLSYNKDGYSKHCKDYTEYKKWEKDRNPVRYESNLNKNYDAKNIMHSVRLMHMAYEIATGQGFNVDRSNIDREFLLNIRNHKFEYDYLINYLEEFKVKMTEAMENSILPDKVDTDKVNELLIKVRKELC